MQTTTRLKTFTLITLGILVSAGWAQDEVPSAPKEDVPSEAKSEAVEKPSEISIELTKGNKIDGIPVDIQELSLNTTFGEVKLPLDRIAGIRFGQGEGSSSTVELINGDSLTGSIPMNAMKVVTDWGECKVNVPFIKSVIMKKGYRWSQNGSRWRMVPSGGTIIRTPVRAQNSAPSYYAAPTG